MKALLTVTALVELATGIALQNDPSAAASLLLGTPLEAPAAPVIARILGAALIAIGAACWFARPDPRGRGGPGLVLALSMYNVSAVAVLAHAGIGLGLMGPILWPAVVLHAALTAWCADCMRATFGRRKSAALPE